MHCEQGNGRWQHRLPTTDLKRGLYWVEHAFGFNEPT